MTRSENRTSSRDTQKIVYTHPFLRIHFFELSKDTFQILSYDVRVILHYISRNKLRGRLNICMVCSNHFSIKFSLAFWGSYLHIFSTFSSKYFIITFYGLHFEKIYSRVHVAFEISNFTIELSKKLFQYMLKSATNINL